MRISWKLIVSLAFAWTLGACVETTPLNEAADRGLQPTAGPAEVRVLGSSVAVRGPVGYCVDTEATRETDIEAFVLLVRCRVTLRPTPVLSATVTRIPAPTSAEPGAMHRLAEYLETPGGRAQLSRSGDPNDVTVRDAQFSDGVIWMLIEDTGNHRAFHPTYWRAVLPIADRIVTLSVLAAREHPFDEGSGLAVLRSFVMRMTSANRD